MLPGIHFEFWEGGNVYERITEADGTVRLCFPEPIEIVLREIKRPSGGQWTTTTRKRSAWHLSCGTTDVWIGNTHIGIPHTGFRGAKRKWHAGGGPHAYF